MESNGGVSFEGLTQTKGESRRPNVYSHLRAKAKAFPCRGIPQSDMFCGLPLSNAVDALISVFVSHCLERNVLALCVHLTSVVRTSVANQ